MNLQKLREKRAELVAKMRGFVDTATKENRDFTAEETKSYDDTKAEVAKVDADISRLEDLEARETSLQASAGAAASRARPTNAPGDPAKKEFESLGHFIYTARFNPTDQRLDFREFAPSGQSAEQRMDDGASGGFAIPVQFRGDLLQVQPYAAVMRPRATVIPPGSPPDGAIIIPALDQSANTNMYGGVTVQWIGEGAIKPDTSAKIRQVTLMPQEVSGTVKFTDKLLRNWGAAGPLLTKLIRGAITAAEDVAFLKGNGVGKPLGVLNSAAAITVNRAVGNQISYTDCLAMEEALFGDGAGAFWVTSKRGRTQLRQLKNPAGYFIWQENAKVDELPLLLGHPVVISDRVPQLGSVGDLMLIDGEKYVIKDGSGPFVAFSEHVYFTTNETVMKCFWNVDGQPWIKAPFVTENGDTQSGFVILH